MGLSHQESRRLLPRHGNAATSECRRGSPDGDGFSGRSDSPTVKPARKTARGSTAARVPIMRRVTSAFHRRPQVLRSRNELRATETGIGLAGPSGSISDWPACAANYCESAQRSGGRHGTRTSEAPAMRPLRRPPSAASPRSSRRSRRSRSSPPPSQRPRASP